MRTLYLLRHAHSLPKEIGQTDKERPLSMIGQSQCVAIGAYILAKNYPIHRVISSDAVRAQQTAQLVAEQIPVAPESMFEEEELYKASIPSFLQMLVNQEPANHILLVGHNPTISYFAEYFSSENLGEVPPGSLLVLTGAITSWSEMAKGNMPLTDKFIPD